MVVKQGNGRYYDDGQQGEVKEMHHMKKAEGKEQQQGNDFSPGQSVVWLLGQGYIAVGEAEGSQINGSTAYKHNGGGDGKKF